MNNNINTSTFLRAVRNAPTRILFEISSPEMNDIYKDLCEHTETFNWPGIYDVIRIQLPRGDIESWRITKSFTANNGKIYFTCVPLTRALNCDYDEEPYLTIEKYINEHSTVSPLIY